MITINKAGSTPWLLNLGLSWVFEELKKTLDYADPQKKPLRCNIILAKDISGWENVNKFNLVTQIRIRNCNDLTQRELKTQ